jgi:rod shape-determining protein MreC
VVRLKKNYFYIAILIIYILFLSKDTLLGLISNNFNLEDNVCSEKENYYKNEYEVLSNLVNLNINEEHITYSKVILRDIYEFYDKITISSGSNSNINVGDAVIFDEGLLGVIKNVYDNYSEVALITNESTNISVKIGNSYGILYAKSGKLYVKNIKLDGNINVGDEVLTSGLTKIPEGIKIGSVSKVEKDNLELEYLLEVEGVSNYQTIKYVGVISS